MKSLFELLALLVCVLAFFRAFRQPAWLLVTISVAVLFPRLAISLLTPYKFALVAATAFTVVWVGWRGSIARIPNDFIVLLLPQLVYGLLRSTIRSEGALVLFGIVGWWLLIVVCSQVVTRIEELRRVGAGMMVGFLCVAAWMTWDWLRVLRSTARTIIRTVGPTGDPNSSTLMALTAVCLAVPWIMTQPQRRRRLLLGTSAALAAFVVFAGNSRGIVVAVAISAMVGALVWGERTSTRIRAALAVVVLAVVAYQLAPTSFQERMSQTVDRDASGRLAVNDSMRAELTLIGLDLLQESPIFGNGERADAARSMRVLGSPVVVHNVFLRRMVVDGIPFGSLYLLMHLVAIFRALQLRLLGSRWRIEATALVVLNLLYLVFGLSNPTHFEPLEMIVMFLASHFYWLARRAEPASAYASTDFERNVASAA